MPHHPPLEQWVGEGLTIDTPPPPGGWSIYGLTKQKFKCLTVWEDQVIYPLCQEAIRWGFEQPKGQIPTLRARISFKTSQKPHPSLPTASGGIVGHTIDRCIID